MTKARLVELVVGKALAEGRSLGGALRALPGEGPARAAAEVEGGRLVEGLIAAGFAIDLAALAEAWPQAVAPAVRRLGAFPTRVTFYAPLLQLLGYLLYVLGIQAVTLILLQVKILPALRNLALDLGAADATLAWAGFGAIAGLVLGVPVVAAVGMGTVRGERAPGWGRHLRRAREAAIAAALRESDAPAEVYTRVARTFTALREPPNRTRDLDATMAAELTRAVTVHARFVAVARATSLGALALVAAGALGAVYLTLARLPVAL